MFQFLCPIRFNITFMKYILILIVVSMISTGQILFKIIAKNMPSSFVILEWIAFIFAPLTLLVLVFYGITTFLWVYILKLYPLSTSYPMMALAFIFVPIASFFLFGEVLTAKFFLGTILIILGVILLSV